jgi:hypothetical protein
MFPPIHYLSIYIMIRPFLSMGLPCPQHTHLLSLSFKEDVYWGDIFPIYIRSYVLKRMFPPTYIIFPFIYDLSIQ